MITKVTGHFVQLVDRMRGRIIYSCFVSGVSKELFDVTWRAIGESIYTSLGTDQLIEYELKITPEYRS